MIDINTLLKQYDEWEDERSRLGVADGTDDSPSSSQWQNSDDGAFSLLEQAIIALRQPLTIWTCSVKSPDSAGMVATVHATEEDCWESLRENYDPEGMVLADAEPVGVVSALEDEGYVIHIDVHEVTR